MCRSILLCGVITQSTKETELQKGQWEWKVGGDRQVSGGGGLVKG